MGMNARGGDETIGGIHSSEQNYCKVSPSPQWEGLEKVIMMSPGINSIHSVIN